MHIGSVAIDPPLLLAPMEGVTDLTFRRLVRRIGGVGLTCTEFVPARGLVADIHRVREMVAFDDDERPIAIQVYGREPEVLARGARVAQELGADIVDLNMGCPSKKVCKNSGGSSLMREPGLATEIIRSIRAAVTVPFTVKMRSGWDPEHKNAPEMAWICQEEGVDAVAVHWRTRTDLYGGDRELDTLAEVKRRLSIPVSANGDIIDVESALQTLAYTGCDGLMIGRGAIRDPWVFRRIQGALEGGAALVVDATAKEQVLLGYFDDILARFGSPRGALGRMKKISRYFTEGLPYGDRIRTAIFHSQTVDEARERVAGYFDLLRVYEAGARNPFEEQATGTS